MSAQTEFMSLCEKMSDEIVKPFVTQKENIYIDSDLLYDYKLGAMLALTKNEEDYNYLCKHLDDYLKAPTIECAKFFPDLGIEEQDLEDILSDPKYYIFLNAAAPATLFVDDLSTIIRIFNTINQSKETTRPLRITINQRRIKMHPMHQKALADHIHDTDPSVVVEFTEYKSWFEVPQALIECQDFICVYNMIEFLQTGTNSQKLLGTVPPKLAKANICTLLQADIPNPTVDHFVNLKVMLEIMCNKFTFRPKTLLNKDLIHG